MLYNWQQNDWLQFRYEIAEVEDLLYAFSEETGHVSGILKGLPEDTQIEAMIDVMVSEAIKTSEIEGEYLSRKDVMSSIRNNLGLNQIPDPVKDKNAGGAGELIVDVRATYRDALMEETLFSWHRMLFKGNRRLSVGAWRSHPEPMQVVSGALGKETVHFEAPPSTEVAGEMKKFIQWFNDTAPDGTQPVKSAPVRAALAHLYFETIHPFEDGNGRIGRAVAEKALSQTLGRPVLLSLSKTIEENKKDYYNALEQAQRSNDVTAWITYFAGVTLLAQRAAKESVDFILRKSTFFNRYKDKMNERQMKAVRRMMDAGPEGFEGGMNARKYISITKSSKATATRDLQQLQEWDILIAKGGGRSTHYLLNI